MYRRNRKEGEALPRSLLTLAENRGRHHVARCLPQTGKGRPSLLSATSTAAGLRCRTAIAAHHRPRRERPEGEGVVATTPSTAAALFEAR
nr:hypothetical protein Iba_chr02cCG9090 [Ipomoea batatas]